MQRLHWQQSIAKLIALTRRRMKQDVWRRLAPYDLTPPQLGMMISLDLSGGVSLVELAHDLGIDAPAACRLVGRLEGRGYLSGAIDPKDRRRSQLRLTPAGKKLAATLSELRSEFERDLEAGLTAAEKATLRKALRKMIANLDRREGIVEAEARPVRSRARARRARR